MNLLRELASDDRKMTGGIMTTYPFAPQFFERAVLPALRKKDADDALAILADTEHYETTLEGATSPTSGLDAHRRPGTAGQAYHLAPIDAGPQRAFHPKVHYLAGPRRVQAVVTSANLTHPGLTANREIATAVTVPKPTEEGATSSPEDVTARDYREQAALCRDVSAFFKTLMETQFGRTIDPITAGTMSEVIEAGEWLHEITQPTERATRLMHSLDRPILPQVEDWIGNETIQEVDIAAPFYGTSVRVPDRFTAADIQTRLWLQQERTQIPAEKVSLWLEDPCAEVHIYESSRYVHGKVLRIQTDTAVYVLSGSPNASSAALLTAAPDGGNIEVAVCRRVSEPEEISYLFETEPFVDASPVDLSTFEPAERSVSDDEPSTEQSDSPPLEIYGIGYRRKDSYDGGTLIVTGRANETMRSAIDKDGATVVLTYPAAQGDNIKPETEHLPPHTIEWADESQRATFTATTVLYGAAADEKFTRPAIVHLEASGEVSDSRWLQTQSPTSGTPRAEDITDAGAKAVPRTLTQLYQDSDQAVAIEALNGLLSALRSADGDIGSPTNATGRQDKDGASGGLHVREWTQTGSDDPAALLRSFFRGWDQDLEAAYSNVRAEEQYLSTVGTRLTAINATTLQLLVLDQTRPTADVPRQLALDTIKRIYSQQGISGDPDSLLADYCAICEHYAGKADADGTIYQGLWEHVVPQIFLAAIIAEAHVAGDRATYFRQQDWAFEQLANNCLPAGHPTAETLSADRIQELTLAIWTSIDGVRDRIEGSRRLRQFADARYMDQDKLEWMVLELLGRCCLLAGVEDIDTGQLTTEQATHLDRVFDECRVYLPQ